MFKENFTLRHGLNVSGVSVLPKVSSIGSEDPQMKLHVHQVPGVRTGEADRRRRSYKQSKTSLKRKFQSSAREGPFALAKPYRPDFRALDSVDDHEFGDSEIYGSMESTDMDIAEVDIISHPLLKVTPLVSEVSILAIGFGMTIAPDREMSIKIETCSIMARIADQFVSLRGNSVDRPEENSCSEGNGPSVHLPPFPLPTMRKAQQTTDSVELEGWKKYNLDFLLTSIRIAYITDFTLIRAGGEKLDPSLGPRNINGTIINFNASGEISSADSDDVFSESSPSPPSSRSLSLDTEQSISGYEQTKHSRIIKSTKLKIGIATIDVAIGHVALSTLVCWKAFAFPGVDFSDILFRLSSFTSSRRLDRKVRRAP